MESSDFGFGGTRDARFATTRWSAVLAARSDSPKGAEAALASLCESYWYPVYAFVRRRGHSSEDACDLTQSFFVHWIEKRALDRADPARGRFRSFLLTCVKNFLANEHERAAAKKRGGGRRIVSIDAGGAEDRYRLEPAETKTAEDLFARRWALTLLDRALERLRKFGESEGGPRHFDRLSAYLTGDAGAPTYAEVARDLGVTEDAVKSSVHRLRRRYREFLREEIADTVSDPADIDDEVSELFKALEA